MSRRGSHVWRKSAVVCLRVSTRFGGDLHIVNVLRSEFLQRVVIISRCGFEKVA